ncbi:MAG TPA: efflux RND transporter periplasmic adaptor subunit [Candidatus Merdousia gallistercoris]|nr:efflux RND transporter periplasmic adaptor subunit [Candidatus Merdousia gallistercoris]
MKNIKTWNVLAKLSAFALAGAAFIAVSGCGKKAPQMAHSAPEVQVSKPIKKTFEVWDEYTARVEPLEFVELRSRVSGYLEKIFFKEGQIVKAGDLLFVIDPRPYEASLAAAKASVKEVEARLLLAKTNLERAKDLLKSNAISKEIYDTRESDVLSTEASLLNAQALLKEAELNLEYTHIRAPISGKVSQRLVDPGNLITANTTVLTTIVNSSIVQAYFEISERDMLRYQNSGLFKEIDVINRKGPPVEMTLWGEEHKPFKGELTYFDNRIGSQTASLTMRADIKNPDHYLAAGMFGKIKVRGGKAQEFLVLPEEIIGTDLINRYVLVVNKDGIVEYRPVKIGRLFGKYRAIEEGVTENDDVIFVGLQRAAPGAKVTPLPLAQSK